MDRTNQETQVTRIDTRLPIALATLAFVAISCSDQSAKTSEKSALHPKDSSSMSQEASASLTEIPLTTISGEPASLADFAGKVVVIVNTASECGYTKQYAGLESLYKKYQGRGLVVLGFPANNFGGQEPGSNDQIATFCQQNYGVTFPMMAKVSVSGDDIHPLFRHLTSQPHLSGPIGWNFSKFILDRSGKLVARFPSSVEPESEELQAKLQSLL